MILRLGLALLMLAIPASAGSPAKARIMKVLHQLVDAEGRTALSPSLFERDAYQVHLRGNPELVAGSRFEIQFKAPRKGGPVQLRVEVRGSRTGLSKVLIFETETLPSRFGSSWGRIELDKETSDSVGSIVAWRASLWRDGEQIAERESFLW